jgi:hypothetical protein
MGVKYNQSGGGGFNPFGLLSTLAMLFPGGQAIAPWIAGAGALTSTLQGHPEEAVKYGAGLLGKGMGGTESVFNEAPIEPTMGMSDVRKYLSDNNPMADTALPDIPAPDITANQRMLNGTESALPWSGADEDKYQGLLGQYGLGGKQAMGENADMGTRYIDNNMPQRNYDYDSLLAQYDLTDMDWTGRKKRRWI